MLFFLAMQLLYHRPYSLTLVRIEVVQYDDAFREKKNDILIAPKHGSNLLFPYSHICQVVGHLEEI